ncbi:SIR2 family protein [Pedobacter arcticus]|uniref:SIR2 family protein n=1 Tax=Pedobacter arcticus TaxID=752140 RepID=UPI0002FFC987|nr:SIR2 family protein [Pedobacter arcticus]
MTEIVKSTKQEFKRKLRDILVDSQRPPFLFVGSGISIRYYSIPTWMDLLEAFVEDNRECFDYKFGYYSSKCSNDPLRIASKLAEEFHEYWWKSEKYNLSREKHQQIAGQDTEIAFKIELSNFVERSIKHSEELLSEIDILSSAVISGILTTNWDDFMQNTFTDFQVEIGQKEAIFADQRAIGELYKIHGCTSKPESLVVTTADYHKFIASNHYLNAKLLTLFAEYPIMFVGYSLSDHNIELIIKNLISCLDKDLFHVEKLKNRLFFVEWQTKPCEPSLEHSTYTMASITIPLIKIKVHDYIDVWEVLSQLPRTLSVKTLRQLQSMVFDFVTTSKPMGKVFVNGIDELDKIENLEVVVGFGNISKLEDKGIIGLKTGDLMEDILFDQISSHNYSEIVEKLLPSVVHQNTFVPFFKYQRGYKNLNKDNSLKQHAGTNFTLSRSASISMDDYRVDSMKTKTMKLVRKYNTLSDLIDDCSEIHAIQRIPYLSQEKIDTNVLLTFLKKNWEELGKKEHPYSTHIRKCICILDFLTYAYQEDKNNN